MDRIHFDWNRCRENMEQAKLLWDEFPGKENLDQLHVQNIDLIFYRINDTLLGDNSFQVCEHQMRMLLSSLNNAFRILLV